MEHKFYTDNFERLLKEQADEFRMYPSKRVWHSIYNDLHPDRKWPSIAVSLVLVTVLFLIGYWNNNTAPDNAGSTQTILIAENATHNSGTNTAAVTGLKNESTQLTNNTSSGIAAVSKTVTVKDGGRSSGKNSFSNLLSKKQPVQEITPGNTGTSNSNNGFTVTKSPAANNTESFGAGNANTLTLVQDKPISKSGESYADASLQIQENLSSAGSSGSYEASGNTFNLTVSESTTAEESPERSNTLSPLDNLSFSAEKTASNKLPAGNDITTRPAAAVKKVLAAKGQLSAEDKSWIDHYALYNKSTRKKWKGRLSSEVYITPGASFRKMVSNTDFNLAAPSILAGTPPQPGTTVSYKPGVSFEAGAGLSFALSKNVRIKAGLQANFTNYSVGVTDINHPVLTTMMLNNLNTGNTYVEARASSLANIPGLNSKRLHNQTSQIALPIGLAVKLAGSEKLEWYAATTVQPTQVFGGKAYLVSADRNYYIADASMIRKWNVNAAAETYIHYKMSGFTLQAGPQLRYQLLSTYSKQYTFSEKLYNIGIKVGIVKNL